MMQQKNQPIWMLDMATLKCQFNQILMSNALEHD